jgi:hypothetical protein
MVSAEAAMACSCALVAPERQLARADGAVSARLLEVERLSDADEPVSTLDRTNFVYRTGRVVKGEARGLQRGRRLVVRSQFSGASCGLDGDVGALTGLFLYRESGHWTSGLCNQISRASMLRLSRRSSDDALRYKTASCLEVAQRHPGRTVGSVRLTW